MYEWIGISLIIVIILLLLSIIPFIIMVLWNWLMPFIFGLPEITFWMALGISVLFTILFKGKIIINEIKK